MAWQIIWPKVNKSWWNSSLVIYILYFSVHVLNTKHTVMSTVCFTESQNKTCHCINNGAKAVQCLLGNFNDSCRQNESRKSYKLFCEVMSQFNCEITYSVKWKCTDCLDAYTKWLLAVYNPNDSDNTWLLNCIEDEKHKLSNLSPKAVVLKLCKDVLARCPYFAPQDSYGDTPAFACPSDSDYVYKPWTCPK